MYNEKEKRSLLQKYIGKEFNEKIRKQIEEEFKPYTVKICDINSFYYEVYYNNKIRCGLVDGKIYDIGFN